MTINVLILKKLEIIGVAICHPFVSEEEHVRNSNLRYCTVTEYRYNCMFIIF